MKKLLYIFALLIIGNVKADGVSVNYAAAHGRQKPNSSPERGDYDCDDFCKILGGESGGNSSMEGFCWCNGDPRLISNRYYELYGQNNTPG